VSYFPQKTTPWSADDGKFELCAGAPDAVADQLGLEALGGRVFERVADRTERFEYAVIVGRLAVIAMLVYWADCLCRGDESVDLEGRSFDPRPAHVTKYLYTSIVTRACYWRRHRIGA
jgi:hypothetical protein